jgi:hypothetical protein
VLFDLGLDDGEPRVLAPERDAFDQSGQAFGVHRRWQRVSHAAA